MFAEDSSQKILVLCNEADVCSSIVVLGKRFEHNLATEGDCVLHCGSLMPAAAALMHPSDPVSWNRVRHVSLLIESSLFHCRLACLKCTKGGDPRLQNGCMVSHSKTLEDSAVPLF